MRYMELRQVNALRLSGNADCAALKQRVAVKKGELNQHSTNPQRHG
jgi:hypothetical protein